MNRTTSSRRILAGVIAAIVLLCVLALLRTTDEPSGGIGATREEADELASDRLVAAPVDKSSERAAVMDRVETPVERASNEPEDAIATCALTVRIFWELDGAPAQDISAKLTYEDGPELRRRIRLGSTGLDGILHVADLPVGRATVTVDRRVSRDVDLRPNETAIVEIPLPAGIDTDVVVMSPAASPVRDAQVWLTYDGSDAARFPLGVTDAAGIVKVRGLHSRDALVAYHADYSPSRVENVCIAEPRPCRTQLELRSGHPVTLVGRVTDAGGTPIEDALVRISTFARLPDSPSGARRYAGDTEVSLYTNSVGSFESPPLASGVHELHASAWSYSHAERRITDDHPIPRSIDMQLVGGIRIEGIVRDTSGALCPAATVSCGNATARSDASGHYELRGADRASTLLFAWHETFGSAEVALKLSSEEHVQQDVVLSTGPVIRGRVVLDDESPLSGWLVCVGVEPRRRGMWARFATTSEDGSFAIMNCDAEKNRLEIRPKDAAHHVIVKVLENVRADGEFLSIRIAWDEVPTATITGRIRGFSDLKSRPRVMFKYADEPKSSWNAELGADGVFHTGLLTRGDYRVLLSCDHRAASEIATVSLDAREAVDLGEVSCP
jgi:hypothetical protein